MYIMLRLIRLWHGLWLAVPIVFYSLNWVGFSEPTTFKLVDLIFCYQLRQCAPLSSYPRIVGHKKRDYTFEKVNKMHRLQFAIAHCVFFKFKSSGRRLQ